jgi:hypothetical protein
VLKAAATLSQSGCHKQPSTIAVIPRTTGILL